MDKIYHIIAGMTIYLLFRIIDPTSALVLVWIAGIGKELYDLKHPDKHTADVWDIVATVTIPSLLYMIEVLL